MTLTIGVAGGSGSGKTTVAHRILEAVGATQIAYVPHDAYYKDLSHLPLEARRRVNFDHPDALETELLIEHLQQLQAGRAVAIPTYDFARYIRLPEKQIVRPAPIILVEGILIFAEAELRKLLDVRIYVDTDADIRLLRRLRRDILERGRNLDTVLTQYEKTVRPMHLEFVEPSKRYADVIIPEGGFNDIAIEMVAAHIRERLQRL